jgi:hypothetical protein
MTAAERARAIAREVSRCSWDHASAAERPQCQCAGCSKARRIVPIIESAITDACAALEGERDRAVWEANNNKALHEAQLRRAISAEHHVRECGRAWEAERNDLTQRLTTLEAACARLRAYADHKFGCPAHALGDERQQWGPCNCGLDALSEPAQREERQGENGPCVCGAWHDGETAWLKRAHRAEALVSPDRKKIPPSPATDE